MKPAQRHAHRAPLTLGAGLMVACLNISPAGAGLEGTHWQLTRYRADAGLAEAAADARRAVLRFEDGRISGSAGCNQLVGGYTLHDGKLQVAPDMASTMMACPPQLMAQEQAVAKALAEAAGYRIGAEGMRLLDAQGRPLLTFTELQPLPLAGTDWRLVSYNNGKGGVTTVLRGTEVSLMIGDDGQFGGKACNSYRGRYTADGGLFQLERPIAATKMACRGPDGAGAQESAYFAALERAAAYRINGNELTLTAAGGAVQLRFRGADRDD
jgi:heat shock protein HslJ